jgi:MerR family copper efflux transcriptional regulator
MSNRAAGPAARTDGLMQVGAVAERLGLSIRSLHHWDEAGLVSPSARSSGGYRLYTEEDVNRLLTVRRMKPLGFSLDEMKQLLTSLAVLDNPDAHPTDTNQARTFITECHQRAQASYESLQQRLAWADEFRHLLADIDDRTPL